MYACSGEMLSAVRVMGSTAERSTPDNLQWCFVLKLQYGRDQVVSCGFTESRVHNIYTYHWSNIVHDRDNLWLQSVTRPLVFNQRGNKSVRYVLLTLIVLVVSRLVLPPPHHHPHLPNAGSNFTLTYPRTYLISSLTNKYSSVVSRCKNLYVIVRSYRKLHTCLSIRDKQV